MFNKKLSINNEIVFNTYYLDNRVIKYFINMKINYIDYREYLCKL